MEIFKHDPAGQIEASDICFCGHTLSDHRLDEYRRKMGAISMCECKEYQSIRGWCNATANSLALLIDALAKRPYKLSRLREQFEGYAPSKNSDKYCLMLRGPIIRDCICGKNDRRKGERRKGLERNARVSYHIGQGQSFLIWQIGFTKDWEQDRRTGKDRRVK